MASGPITSWQIDGEKVERVVYFLFLGSKVTVVSDYSPEIKRCFLLGRKAMTNLDSILKSRDSTLLTKVCIVKAMVFPVVMYGCESWTMIVMYGCESWTMKKGECQRIDALELWCLKTLDSPLNYKEIKPVNSKSIQP